MNESVIRSLADTRTIVLQRLTIEYIQLRDAMTVVGCAFTLYQKVFRKFHTINSEQQLKSLQTQQHGSLDSRRNIPAKNEKKKLQNWRENI